MLTVGGVRPNKGHADLIEAFALYYYTCQTQARLFIVGAEDDVFKPYAKELRKLIDRTEFGKEPQPGTLCRRVFESLQELPALTEKLATALVDDPPMVLK